MSQSAESDALAGLLDEQCDYLIREARAEALYAARDALYRGEGPDMFEDSDIVYGEWLSNRADAIDGAS
jgi:hypothetical protein